MLQSAILAGVVIGGYPSSMMKQRWDYDGVWQDELHN